MTKATKKKESKGSNKPLLNADWRSFEDGIFPPYDKPVLLWNSYHKKIEIGYRKATDSRGEHWSVEYEHHFTHWMELPTPPICV